MHSTLKTSAILIATLTGLLLGNVPVSASTESERWVAPIPSPEDCRDVPSLTIYDTWIYESGERPLDYLGERIGDLSTSPELINCPVNWRGLTIAHLAAAYGGPSPNVAKWAVLKGIDLTIGYNGNHNIYGTAYHDAIYHSKEVHRMYNPEIRRKYRITEENYLKVAEILKPPPAPATKPCAEVDGTSPFSEYYNSSDDFPDYPEIKPNEYCIVAENTQESFKSRLISPIFDGYQHITTAKSSGVGFFKEWRSTITFYCRAPLEEICGPLDYTVDDNWSEEVAQEIKDTYGLYIRCGDSINLLDVDAINAGGGAEIHMHQPWIVSPYSHNCKAHSSNPFTLSIKTVRLAQ